LTAALAAALLGTGAARPAAARGPDGDTPVTVTIGGVWCFIVRCPDGAMTAAERVDQIHNVFAKHLGTPEGVITLRKAKDSSRIDILLNGDLAISVTTNDARAVNFPKTDELAAQWKAALEKAFDETHAKPESQHN
jgi:hypothetical protein